MPCGQDQPKPEPETRPRGVAKRSSLTRYPVLSLTVVNVTSVAGAVWLLFVDWRLAIGLLALAVVASAAFVTWLIRGRPDDWDR